MKVGDLVMLEGGYWIGIITAQHASGCWVFFSDGSQCFHREENLEVL